MWTTQYLDNFFGFEWENTKSPAGAIQWTPKDGGGANLVPDDHDKTKRHAPIMFTTDMAIKVDPSYRKIAERFHQDPKEFELAFAKAWFKLTHRDMGPRARYLGKDAPDVDLIWQDPIPAVDYDLVNSSDIVKLKSPILDSGLSVPELVRVAWGSAASFRGTDMRGGANGARISLAPQKDWPVNDPKEVAEVLTGLEKIQSKFNKGQKGGFEVSVPFTPDVTMQPSSRPTLILLLYLNLRLMAFVITLVKTLSNRLPSSWWIKPIHFL
ncbi:MAG: catalase-peroxidase [Paraglaciecola sp.]